MFRHQCLRQTLMQCTWKRLRQCLKISLVSYLPSSNLKFPFKLFKPLENSVSIQVFFDAIYHYSCYKHVINWSMRFVAHRLRNTPSIKILGSICMRYSKSKWLLVFPLVIASMLVSPSVRVAAAEAELSSITLFVEGMMKSIGGVT